jgi:outer membrane protein assembly factor BamB
VARDGIVYVIGGGGPSTPAAALAVKTGGSGDVTKSHVIWRIKAGATNCSPVLTGDFLCWVDGTVTCVSIADGKTAYRERLYEKSEYCSPIVAGDKIYAITRASGMFVIAGGGDFKRHARLEFKGDDSIFNASPAVSDGRLYIRSNEYLYCVGKK